MEHTDTAPQTQTLPDSPKWTGYLSCEVLPLPIFIDCLLSQEYTKLITEGTATEEELATLWMELYSEYCKMSGNSAMDAILIQMWQLYTMEARLNHISRLLKGLADHPAQAMVECLALRGYHVRAPLDDADALETAIRRLTAQLQGEQYKFKKLSETLQSLKKEEVTRIHFIQQLMDVSKHEGYPVREREITTAEYCLYVKRLRDHVELLNSQNNAG